MKMRRVGGLSKPVKGGGTMRYDSGRLATSGFRPSSPVLPTLPPSSSSYQQPEDDEG